MFIYREGKDLLTIWDAIIPPFILFAIFLYAYLTKIRKIDKRPEYSFYVKGMTLKIMGGFSFLVIYLFYYGGGDTTLYYQSCESLLNLSKVNFGKFFSIMMGNLSQENASLFGPEIGYNYYYRDFQSYSVVRFSSIFVFMVGRSYVAATILIAAFTYGGLWSLFKLLYHRFPNDKKAIVFAIFYIPSTLFWGSGLLKDSYTLMATCYFFVAFYNLIVLKKNMVKNIFLILLASFILISLKPYIFFALIAAVFITLIHINSSYIKNKIIKTFVIPVLIVVIIVGGLQFIQIMGENIGGHYSSIDKMLEKAVINQQDLKQSYYGGNSFDIGYFEPTIPGILSKLPVATIAGLFRPFLWEARNPVMLISALENSIFLFLTFYVLFLSFLTWRQYNWKYMKNILFSDPFIVFSIVFSFVFAFFIGLTTSNFGALVRYKIPLIPFFMSTLFIIVHNFNIERNKWRK